MVDLMRNRGWMYCTVHLDGRERGGVAARIMGITSEAEKNLRGFVRDVADSRILARARPRRRPSRPGAGASGYI